MHLFTGHKAIQTEPLNINFIFADLSAMLTQWSYIYTRLPYLLVYIHRIVEHICAGIAPTNPAYTSDMERRISALVLLWWDTVEAPYTEPHLENFVAKTRDRLHEHCVTSGFRAPSRCDLVRMGRDGAYPGESKSAVRRRYKQFVREAEASGAIARQPLAGIVRSFVSKLRSKR
jgi:nitroreductase